MKKIILLLCITGLVISCTKDESNLHTPGFNTPVITGFTLIDHFDTYVGTIGIPNDNIEDNGETVLKVFPNPAIYNITININFSEEIKENAGLWITTGNYINPDTETSTKLGSNLLIDGGSPIFQLKKLFSNKMNISVDLRNFPDGYYRVYAQNGNKQYWFNIIVIKRIGI